MIDYELALKYKPCLFFDIKEPFPVKAVGYTVFRKRSCSKSFPKRMINYDKKVCAFIIEYAVWFDYDIEHLYDLEHIWVMVGYNGEVIDAEGSFHGKYLKAVDPKNGRPILAGDTHVIAYSQPGKHAFLPDPDLFRLVPFWRESCTENAGVNGVLVPDMFGDLLQIEEECNELVHRYIHQNYAFEPSMKFEFRECSDDLFMEWDQLYKAIPARIKKRCEEIKEIMNIT